MKDGRCIMCLVLIVSGRKAEPSREKCRCHMFNENEFYKYV